MTRAQKIAQAITEKHGDDLLAIVTELVEREVALEARVAKLETRVDRTRAMIRPVYRRRR